jgi:predicted ATP-grasp superfamily ATP-dependent carboligase
MPPALAERTVRLGEAAIAWLPNPCGYIGIDLILGDAADGSNDYVIEINPRLTTSYIGLRALAQDNLAQAMVRIAMGAWSEALQWRSGYVDFSPDGAVTALAEARG